MLKIKKGTACFISAFMAVAALSAVAAACVDGQNVYDITAFIFITLGTGFVFKGLSGTGFLERLAVLSGYFIRLALVISEAYFDGALNFFVLCTDAAGFYNVSLDYYRGNFSEYYTSYPYVLNFFHHIFGPGKVMPLYVNVFAWYLCWKLLDRVLKRCRLHMREFLAAAFCLLPAGIFMTAEMLRESMMMLSITLSVYYLWKWMEDGKIQNLVISAAASFPAVLLHSASIAVWAGILSAYLFWNTEKQRWAFGRRQALHAMMGAAAVFVFFYFRLYARMGYFPSELSIETITNRMFYSGRSDYLRDIQVSGMAQFLFWTVIRSFYFWFSPVISDWTGIKDVAAAVADALPLMILLVMAAKGSKGSGKYLTGVVILLAYTFIYAWATSNAGTAVRHRNMLMGIVVMTCAAVYGNRDACVLRKGFKIKEDDT